MQHKLIRSLLMITIIKGRSISLGCMMVSVGTGTPTSKCILGSSEMGQDMDLVSIHLSMVTDMKGNTTMVLRMGMGCSISIMVTQWLQFIGIIRQMGWESSILLMGIGYRLNLLITLWRGGPLKYMRMGVRLLNTM